MSRFFIGQRVRVVGCDPDDTEAMKVVGRETVINELDCFNEAGDPGYIGVTIDGNEDWCFLPHQLEPLTDSYDVTSWDSCVWKPEHLRVGA
jgi:hypothetical protein